MNFDDCFCGADFQKNNPVFEIVLHDPGRVPLKIIIGITQQCVHFIGDEMLIAHDSRKKII